LERAKKLAVSLLKAPLWGKIEVLSDKGLCKLSKPFLSAAILTLKWMV
jgi:hypothetical protein